jgi:hypothetical protein
LHREALQLVCGAVVALAEGFHSNTSIVLIDQSDEPVEDNALLLLWSPVHFFASSI